MNRWLTNRKRVSVEALLVVGLVAAMWATSGAVSAANTIVKGGRAYVLSIGTTTVLDTGLVSTTDSGTTDMQLASLPGPNPAGTLLDARVVTQPTEATATASVATLFANIGIPIAGAAVVAHSDTNCVPNTSLTPPDATTSSGFTTIAFLQVGTTTIANASPAPNTVLVNTPLLKVVLNEQVTNLHALKVNAVHVTAPGIDVIISSATSFAFNCSGVVRST